MSYLNMEKTRVAGVAETLNRLPERMLVNFLLPPKTIFSISPRILDLKITYFSLFLYYSLLFVYKIKHGLLYIK